MSGSNTFSKFEFFKIFIATFAAIWTFLESGEHYLGVITIPSKGWLFYSGIFVLSIGLCAGYSLYARRKNINYLIQDISEKVHDKHNLLFRRYKAMMVDQSYFKLIFAQWRMESELEKSKMVDGGHFALPAKTAFDYIIYVYSSLLNRLRHTDEFMTLSSIDFWERVIKTQSAFLTENLRAIEKNVVIRRIILVDKKTIEARESSVERAKVNFVAKYMYERYQRNTATFNRMEWYFYISDQYEIDKQAPVPYAILYNRLFNEYLGVLPIFSNTIEDDSMIEFHFSQRHNDDRILPYVHRFNEIILQQTNLYSITAFYRELFEGKFQERHYRHLSLC